MKIKLPALEIPGTVNEIPSKFHFYYSVLSQAVHKGNQGRTKKTRKHGNVN